MISCSLEQETEAEAAGDDGMITYHDNNGLYEYGPFAVSALDKVITISSHSTGSDKWFERQITFNSSKLLAAATDAVDNSTALPDGTYTPENFTATGGTGKVTITCPQVIVENGKAFADVTFSSKKYVYVKANNQLFNGTVNTSGVTYRIPVDLNEDVKILALTTGMSMAHEIAYTLHVTLNETPAPTATPVLLHTHLLRRRLPHLQQLQQLH